ncbi:acyl carrier protein [Hymenobacter sp.]|uniref:acyl carrier protein n=1 Tax=Hymenobacter sp. TaxID=1898978 RepID=UPI00286B63F9|nr:acyl carrier protein [Hymenobacter sp.]
MTDSELELCIAGIVARVQGQLTAAQVSPAAGLGPDLGLDSLEVLEVILAVEDRFNFSIPDVEVAGIHSVRDLVGFAARAPTQRALKPT